MLKGKGEQGRLNTAESLHAIPAYVGYSLGEAWNDRGKAWKGRTKHNDKYKG